MMPQQWIEQRFADYKQAEEERKRIEQDKQQASRDAPAMFDQLMACMVADVQESNSLFQGSPWSQVKWNREGPSIMHFERIDFPLPPLEVELDRGSGIISYRWHRDPMGHPAPDSLTPTGTILLRVDSTNGKTVYVTDQQQTLDPAVISQKILDYILPNAKDFDPR